jgi:hypothetical protein
VDTHLSKVDLGRGAKPNRSANAKDGVAQFTLSNGPRRLMEVIIDSRDCSDRGKDGPVMRGAPIARSMIGGIAPR